MKVAAKGLLCAVACVAFGSVSVSARAVEAERSGGPYVPTPQVVVDEMLRMAKVGPDDFVIDLGSGDGVIVLTAASRLKASGFGVDIDPDLVKQSNARARTLGVADRAAFQVQDVFKADLGRATVVTLYLLPAMMAKLRPKLFNELRPGTRVVSHDYLFDAWRPDDQTEFHVPEKEEVMGLPTAHVYLWLVPARVAGRWQLKIDGRDAMNGFLHLSQRYQEFEGDGHLAGRPVSVPRAVLRGEAITFSIPAPEGPKVFTGKVTGNAMEGSMELPRGRGRARWTAARVPG